MTTYMVENLIGSLASASINRLLARALSAAGAAPASS